MKKLPKEYEEICKDFYINYVGAASFFRKLALVVQKWSHLKTINSYKSIESILEIGVVDLNHLKF